MEIQRVTRHLNVGMVEEAYRVGIFPMADTELGIITWHRPRRRALLPLDGFHISRSLGRTLRRGNFEVTFDRDFGGVMAACGEREPTWISPEFKEVYGELHAQGKAVHLGGAFFAESKFHRVTDMSKVALAHLVARLRERGFALLEVQYLTEHLGQFGVVELSDREYI
jgi:leucyl/phenylalanyl-tRNA--protein transferase